MDINPIKTKRDFILLLRATVANLKLVESESRKYLTGDSWVIHGGQVTRCRLFLTKLIEALECEPEKEKKK